MLGLDVSRRRWALSALSILAFVSALGIVLMIASGSLNAGELIVNLVHQARGSYGWVLLIFIVLSILSQLLILPNGSLLLIVGGFVLGAPVATTVYALAQMVMAPLVYSMARTGYGDYADEKFDSTLKHVPESWRNLLLTMRDEELLASVAIRLTPVIPSAVACLLAAGLGIGRKAFLLGTAFSCWIRPLFFASIGASTQMLMELTDPAKILENVSFIPLIMAFVAASLLFALRVWLQLRA